MAVATTDPKHRSEPNIQAGFAIELGRQVKGWFTECSGLTVEREVKTYQEGGVNEFVHQLPGRIKRANITLKHGLAGNELWNWFEQGARTGQIERRNVSIVLYDAQKREVKRWDLVDVYPAKWSGSSFNSAANEAVVETLEFAYLGSSSEPAAMAQRQTADHHQPAAAVEAIDLKALTKKVYALFRQELRLEQERLGRRN